MIENKEVSNIIDRTFEEAVRKIEEKTGFKVGLGWWFKNPVVKKPDE